ncbi:transglutaminase domain-containing protein [Cochleicola gelatinilyticus]|uniref:Transglutaminase-like domain-containing protein n=1 Tax=Cochleicola gelatinilyticus TaxID=1763537 RepID=A0A167IQH8_9FLAO|nr:transglutaminase domain-containing protein [Cochleicola gelatinilyticus]OAB79912.1 hypothetical protein ULVI_04010 [Cochleicola gelatinilyticus]
MRSLSRLQIRGARLVLFVLLFVGSFSISFAQDYERVDATIQLYPEEFQNAEALSKLISRDFFTSEEKVRAIYSWIIQNVAYDPEEYKQFNFSFKDYRERNTKEEKTREQIIKRTLQKGVAVCEGYALLFEKLCELQGIPNYLVRGDTKAGFQDIGRPFKKSHMWNVATIDGKSYLFDPTWGAGRYNGTFIKDPSYFYFKTPPELFFKNHYPDMYEDAFIDEVISKEVFASMPIIIPEKLRREDVEMPLNGIISSQGANGEVTFQLRNVNPELISYSYGASKKEVTRIKKEDNRLHFVVPLQIGVENLLIYFDGEPALGYKIQ